MKNKSNKQINQLVICELNKSILLYIQDWKICEFHAKNFKISSMKYEQKFTSQMTWNRRRLATDTSSEET